jgi:dTDP-4-dehydrorhamnose reductase
LGRADFDISNPHKVESVVRNTKANILFNAAAYTAVDKAENEQADARSINATAVASLAKFCRIYNTRLVHLSTDFVFDGTSAQPYMPDDKPNPLNIYGRTKWEGEQLAGSEALIVRTAWIYDATGHNFLRTMLGLMVERDEIKVVTDQIGTPTYAPSLASALWDLALHNKNGVFHYTDSGVASWYDFAVAIQEEALILGVLNKTITLTPIASWQYKTQAKRPAISILDKAKTWEALGKIAPHWRTNLRKALLEIKQHG